jgi:thiol-disulfide isomerase/thioredoxin
MRAGLLALATLALSCAHAPPPTPPAPSPPAPATALPFIEDDFPRALAEGRRTNRLVFVDAWAPWCHTCLSMQAYTLRDPKILARANDFVWAAIDTEKAKNAAWVEANPTHGLPTFFVFDAKTEKPVFEWAGSATADELGAILDHATGAKASEPEALALESKLESLLSQKDFAGCAETADRELPRIAHGVARAATYALDCAGDRPDGEAKRAVLGRLLPRAKAIAADRTEPMLADDRSDLFNVMVGVLEDDKREAEAQETARAWSAFLDGEAQRAPDAKARAVFDAHRTEAYLAIGAPERAIPMLEESARDFPEDYNPHARLARAYHAMHREDDAARAIDRAIALAYGPRTLLLLSLKADIAHAKGDRAGEIATLQGALARADAMKPLAPRYQRVRAELEKRLGAAQASPAPASPSGP